MIFEGAKMNCKIFPFSVFSSLLVTLIPTLAFAVEGEVAGGKNGLIAIGAGLAVGLGALGGTLAQAKAVSSSLESIGRNPGAAGNLFTPMIIGLVLIESLVLFSFIIAYLLSGSL
jgi:F-type H+-transporting ATPase subunit c